MFSPKYENPQKSPFVELLDQILSQEDKLKELAGIAFDTVDVNRVGYIEREELIALILQMGGEIGFKRPPEQEIVLLLKDLKKRADQVDGGAALSGILPSPGGGLAQEAQLTSFSNNNTGTISGTQTAVTQLPVKIKRAEFIEIFWILMNRIKETQEELQEKLEEARLMKELLQAQEESGHKES